MSLEWESASQAAAEMEVKLVVCFLCDYILAEVHKPVLRVGLQLGSFPFNKINILMMKIKGCRLFSLQ